MKVSIVVLVYNHGQFLEECLNSIFSQKIDVEFEVLIGEDASTDNSRIICQEFKNVYPNRVKLFQRKKNIGMLNNFYDLIERSSGEYTAFLEGDDFWSDKQKLNFQIKALDKNQDCTIAYHNVKMFFSEGLIGKDKLYVKSNQPLKVDVNDVIKKEVFMHTSSLMIRSVDIKNTPSSFLSYPMGDIPLTIFALRNMSKAVYINRVMSNYRKNIGGITFKFNKNRIDIVYKCILMYRDLNGLFKYKFNKSFIRAELKKHVELTSIHLKNRNFNEAIVSQKVCFQYIISSNLKLFAKIIFNSIKIKLKIS